MITFQELTHRLTTSQLKNTSAVDEENKGVLNPEYESTILSLTNQGLLDLSTRFPIFKSHVDLTFIFGQNIYPLTATQIGTYLTDEVGNLFVDEDFIRVLDVYDESGERHPINTNGHILTPTYNVLRFTEAKMLEFRKTSRSPIGRVRIQYQRKHPTINALSTIYIPPNLETALQLFVSALYLSHMGGEEHSAKGDSYYATYLRHVGEDEAKDLSSTSEVEIGNKFQARGFV